MKRIIKDVTKRLAAKAQIEHATLSPRSPSPVFRSSSPIIIAAQAMGFNSYGSTHELVRTDTEDENPDELFTKEVEREAVKVELFYESMLAEISARLDTIAESIKRVRLGRKHRSMGGSESEDEEGALTSDVHATESIKRSCVDLYRQMNYLTNYTIINYTAFVKICKKHDKETNVPTTKKLMFMVEQKGFAKATALNKIVSTMERLYADEFCGRNITVARSDLVVKKRGHNADFELMHMGFRMGVIAMLVCWVVWVLAVDSIVKPNPSQLPATVFVVYRGMSTLVLAQWCWVFCLWAWESARVNYMYLFEFDPHNAMVPITVARRCSSVTILFLVNFLVYLKVARGEMLYLSPSSAPAFPIGMFIIIMLLAVLSRWGGVGSYVLGSVLIAPFGEVTFLHSFVADVLTSLVRPLVDLTFSVCFFLSGDWRTPTKPSVCMSAWEYHHIVVPVVLTLPLWFRFMQCLRRYYDTHRRVPNLLNAVKYIIAYSVVMFSSLANNDASFFSMWVTAAVFSTLITYLWDVWMDWGLGRCQYKLLRDRLMFAGTAPYYAAITLDLGLRFLWTLTLVPSINLFLAGGASPGVASDEQSPLSMYVTALISWAEICRRSMWACLRVEHEHLVNTQGFRRVDFVPLHFDSSMVADDKSVKDKGNRLGLLFEVFIFVGVVFIVGFVSFKEQWSETPSFR